METRIDGDVLKLWQQHAREEPSPRLEDVRTKAERLDAKTRRWRVITMALFILLLIKGAVEVSTQTETLERATDLLLMTALIYVAYRYRRWRLSAPPVALGRTNCLEFYRAQLVRQRDLSKDGWGYLLPFAPGITLAILDGVLTDRPTTDDIVLVLLGVALFVGIAGWNAYTAHRFQYEIEALDNS